MTAPIHDHIGIRVLTLCVLIAPTQAPADWRTEFALGSELGGNASLHWLLERRSTPITQRVAFDYLNQSGGDRHLLGYRLQFNLSSSFYHFAHLTSGANRPAGVEARQTAVLATANSPYRGRTWGLELELGGGFQHLQLADHLADNHASDVQPVLLLRGRVSRSLGRSFVAELDVLNFSGGDHTDLTATLQASWQFNADTRLRLGYRMHRINQYRGADIDDAALMLSIGYRIDWMPTSNRWPDT